MRDAGSEGDDERRTVERFGLLERLDGLGVVGAHRHARDIDVAVFIAISARSFFAVSLPPAANFATAPRGVDFDDCPPVFEYTSVSSTSTFTFCPERQHVIETAEPDS